MSPPRTSEGRCLWGGGHRCSSSPMFLLTGLGNPVHLPNAPPQFSSMDDLGGGAGRAKRYSSQRQRAVPEPAPPMHLGVMEGHFYEPSKS